MHEHRHMNPWGALTAHLAGLHGRHPAARPPATTGRLIRWARFYDPVVRILTLGRDGALRQRTVALAGIRSGDAVLDVGCGTGDLTLRAARRSGAATGVCGIDAAPEMVAVARRKARRAGLPARFEVAAVEALPYADATFDVVLSSLMFHHLPGDLQDRALAEIRRVLRPGGRLLIVDFMPRPDEAPPPLHGDSMPAGADVAARVRAAEFGTVERGALGLLRLGYVRARTPSPGA